MIIGVRKHVAACCWTQSLKVSLCLFILFSTAPLARSAEIGCVYPAGGAPGTTFEVSVRGLGLKTATGAHMSGSGVDAALIKVIPFDPATQDKRRRAPSLQDEVVLRVTIAKGTPPGPRDFRLFCGNAFTAPLPFHVGRYPEVLEAASDGMQLQSLPVCVNGRITEPGADTFRFKAAQGQTLVAQVQGHALAPQRSEAVSDGFRPLLKICDSQGRELLSAGGFRFDPAPILVFDVPATGDYALQLCDAQRRGRADFVYRLTFGELPLVTGFFPQGGKKGDSLNITLEGVNLPPQKVRIFSGNKTPQTCLQALVDGKLFFPSLRFDLDNLPEESEAEALAGASPPQSVLLPVIVSATLGQPNEVDLYRFEGKAGQDIAIETRAHQLGSPLDAVVTLADSRGKVLATQDDPTNVFTGLLTAPCDAALTARLPADDTYEVRVRDKGGKGGPDYHYRLRLSEPRPGFELWVTPSTLSIPLGGKAQANVHARRLDGFTGPIAIQLDNPPLGISCDGGNIPSNATESVIALSCWPSTKRLPQGPFELNLSGVATNGAAVLRQAAVPAHRTPQSPCYKYLVPDQVWLAVVDTEPAAVNTWRIALPPGTTHIGAKAKEPFDVTISSGKARALAAYTIVSVTEPQNGFIVTQVRDGAYPGDLVVTLTSAEGERAPPKVGNLLLSVSRKSAKGKLINRAKPSAAINATPYVIE
jgi:hypothetical protein